MDSIKIIAGDLAALKETYTRQGCVKLPDCLDPSVKNLLTSSFNQSFEKRFILDDLSSEHTLTNPLLKTKLQFIFNTPEFLQKMSEITGNKIKQSKQRVYFTDSTCISLPWHDDSYDKDGRVAAIRFELSDAAYEGGDFLFKDQKREYKFEHLHLGESVLFKIEYDKYFHMVSPVTQGIRKSLIVFLCE